MKIGITALVVCVILGLFSSTVGANLEHKPNYSHIKLMMIDYRNNNTPEELEFMATHYDAAMGGSNQGIGDNPHFTYNNYYCIYVGNSEWNHMINWATNRGVDPETFLIHYSEETLASYGSESYLLPAGSRVPTYNWYGSAGDLTKKGSRVVMNVGNPDYVAWKLDYLEESMISQGTDGIFIDNTSFDHFIKIPSTSSGGTIEEYPSNPGISYGNDLLIMFGKFHERFGSTYVQVPNVSNYPDDPRVYPYIWGVYREATLQPHKGVWFESIEKNVAASASAGVMNLFGGFAERPEDEMGFLASYYILKDDTCYFFPFLKYVADLWDIDPRLNQWIPAVETNIGQPIGTRYSIQKGIDPSSSMVDSMNATVVKEGWAYRLTDTSKSWNPEQWKNLWVIFPSGYSIKAYHSGDNWITVYGPAEVPVDGMYEIGEFPYNVDAREYENGLALYRGKLWNNPEVGGASSVDVLLPSPYYILDRDGNLSETSVDRVALNNAEGAVLIKSGVPVPPQHAPIANAGPDQLLETEGQTATFVLDGSGSSDEDGDALSYEWKDSDGVVGNQAVITLVREPGDYLFTLTVTDTTSRSDSDTVMVGIQVIITPITELKNRVIVLESEVVELNTRIAVLETDVSPLLVQVQGLLTQIDSLETDVIQLWARNGVLEAEVEELKTLEPRILSLERTIQALRTALSAE